MDGITSSRNPRIKYVVQLRNRRHRDACGEAIIEGYRALLRAWQNGYPVRELFVCPDLFLGGNEEKLIQSFRRQGTSVVQTSEAPFRKMAYRDRPEGLLGVGPQRRYGLQDLSLGDNPLLLVAEGIEKPGNLGTMLRSSDAVGLDALIVCDSCTDVFNPNVVRASVGTLFSVPVAEADVTETVKWLQTNGIKSVIADPHTERLYTEVEMTGPIAVVVGTEQYGLSEQWLDSGDVCCRMPMFGQADSLNVATSSAVMLYEAIRQRIVNGRITA